MDTFRRTSGKRIQNRGTLLLLHSRMSNLTPIDFLTFTEAISLLKRKAYLLHRSFASFKRVRLELTPKVNDLMITKHYERIRFLLSEIRNKLYIYIPFQKKLGQIQDLKVIKSVFIWVCFFLDL